MNKSQWINVNERLPAKEIGRTVSKEVIVLVLFKSGNVSKARRADNGVRIVWCLWDQDAGYSEEVTHWMLQSPGQKD